MIVLRGKSRSVNRLRQLRLNGASAFLGGTVSSRLADLKREEEQYQEIEAGLSRLLTRMDPQRAAPLQELLSETIQLRQKYIQEEIHAIYRS